MCILKFLYSIFIVEARLFFIHYTPNFQTRSSVVTSAKAKRITPYYSINRDIDSMGLFHFSEYSASLQQSSVTGT